MIFLNNYNNLFFYHYVYNIYLKFLQLQISWNFKKDNLRIFKFINYLEMSSDLDVHLETLRNGQFLKESEVKELCARAREIFVEESNV